MVGGTRTRTGGRSTGGRTRAIASFVMQPPSLPIVPPSPSIARIIASQMPERITRCPMRRWTRDPDGGCRYLSSPSEVTNGTRLGSYEGRLRVRASGQARVACRFPNAFRDTRRPPSLFCHSVSSAAEDAEPLLCSRGLNNRKMDARDTMGSPSRAAAAAAPLHLTWRNSRAIVTGETDERRRASERGRSLHLGQQGQSPNSPSFHPLFHLFCQSFSSEEVIFFLSILLYGGVKPIYKQSITTILKYL